jgi:hypothetical protein
VTAQTPIVAPEGAAATLRRILALAAPTTALSLLQAAAQLMETWLAARQGTAALAGWAVVLPFALLLQMMSVGAMGGGVVSAIARALGAGRREEASALVLHAVLIALAAGLLFAAALAGFPQAVFGAIAGQEAAAAAVPYAIWLFGLGAVPAWLANTLASVLRGGGRHGLAARVMAGAWIVYPGLAWVLMEPLGMALPGLGLAYAIVFWSATIAMAVVVLRGGAGLRAGAAGEALGRPVPSHPVGRARRLRAGHPREPGNHSRHGAGRAPRSGGRCGLRRRGAARVPDDPAGLRRGLGADGAGRARSGRGRLGFGPPHGLGGRRAGIRARRAGGRGGGAGARLLRGCLCLRPRGGRDRRARAAAHGTGLRGVRARHGALLRLDGRGADALAHRGGDGAGLAGRRAAAGCWRTRSGWGSTATSSAWRSASRPMAC